MKELILRIVIWVVFLALTSLFIYRCSTEDKRAYYETKKENTITGYELFISKNPKSKYVKDAYGELYNFTLEENSISSLKKYQLYYRSSPFVEAAEKRIDLICDSLYKIAQIKNTIQGWQIYQREVPNDKIRDAEIKIDNICDSLYSIAYKKNSIDAWNLFISEVPKEKVKDALNKIEIIENELWSTESSAWKRAISLENISSYKKFISLYPNSSKRSLAEKKLIDLEVKEVMGGEYSTLPKMDVTRKGYGSSSTVKVENQTSYNLTLLYSGPDSKRIVISPKSTKSFSIRNGNYKIAASVDAKNVRPFVGSELLDGSFYNASYYISTSRYGY